MSLPSSLPSCVVDAPPATSFETQPSAHWALGNDVSILPRIFEHDISITVMQRTLSPSLEHSIQAQCETERRWSFQWLGVPDDAMKRELRRSMPVQEQAGPLVDDVLLVTQAMAMLFDTDTLGVRLRLLDSAMCPRFHCDKLPVRLVTSYRGPGSEWLPESAVNRAGLGAPSPNKPETLRQPHAIERLASGDLALLKGDGWSGNEGRGLVHRSPAQQAGETRLLLTIDPS
ncbi:MAG: hypothetical protein CME82_14745 [Halomonas sp.]|nr:hypothetical protein [Halomonas sp.]|tara:strand:- start:454 stop:1143 length:690 start_codon:yes stop_codon:yes gene_type:complete